MALQKVTKEKIMSEVKIHGQDTGSEYVQVALLTERIRMLTEHLKHNKKDFSSKKGLLHLISQRNNFLKYLERKNAKKYREFVKKLGIKG